MWKVNSLRSLGSIALIAMAALGVARADSVVQVSSSSDQGANDSLAWNQKGTDGTVLPVSFSAQTALSNNVTVNLGAANSIISTVCAASPCSWTGGGFTAGDALLWTSDAGNGGSGPVTLNFATAVAAAGALIQSDLPGQFTGQIQVYNGATLLAAYTVTSDPSGDPVYLGALDQSGPNITSVTFSLTACATLCTDFGLDTVNVNASIAPSLSSPSSPSTLAGSNVTFTWNPGTATMFQFRLGNILGANDVFSSGPTSATSETVTTIPTEDHPLYARLYYQVGGAWEYIDYVFTEAGTPTTPSLTLPVAGSTLSGSTATFTWDPGSATRFRFRLGTTLGGNDVFGSGDTYKNSVEVISLPTNGVTLHARLSYSASGTWQSIDYTFKEFGTFSPPALTAPSGPTPLSGSTVFTWDPGAGSTQFRLKVGTTGVGSSDLFDSQPVPLGTTAEAVDIPANGTNVYVRLAYRVNGAWQRTDYTFTEAP